ncbi:hypothetical protein L348_05785 [Enterobacter sp. MGH 2]|uniref:hypothetical protein n=1 Tax=Enterobacter cloacae complex TaxID=354276 RepID=UPI00044E46E3|nr:MULTISPECIES: hypothetical protein [Enterobacter cloacae complex]EUM36799.1 hypothetical protein L407_01388 [Enterobacter sp. BWH 39]EUM80291.1 hypothetical protein L355_04820 [Enterobacter sp. MGH 9]EUM98898.1 hypothetical protein L351_04830 [Enterobacter sp. MGH 5]EUN08999.1 hypothetical protein L348_05785 [Enterobacter sp. MGH 2]EZR14130.1 hypothetical protein L398_01574 [Enterobacter sp. BWH 27]
MTATAEKFLITNESEFEAFIAKMMGRKDLDSDEFCFPDLEFKGWPTISINVKGDKKRYSSSLTASMLFGMAELTNEIQKAFTVIRHDTHNRQKLTNSDKHLLDIVYHISEGSSQADGDSDAIVNGAVSVIKEAIGKMNGRQALCALVAIVIAAGTVGWKVADEYWETQRQSSSDQISLVKESTSAVLESQKSTLELLKTGQTTVSREVLAHGEDGRNKFLKSIAQDPKVTTVKLGEQVINRDQLNTYNQRQSVDRKKDTRQDEFYIRGISRSGATNQDISIAVIRASNGEGFTIKTTADITSTDELLVFSQAVATESPLEISYLEVTENGHVSAGQLINIIPQAEEQVIEKGDLISHRVDEDIAPNVITDNSKSKKK